MAGRRRLPITGTGPRADLARRLRDLRDDADLTLQQLAERSGYSRAALSAAEAARHVPSWDLITAFVQGCGGAAEHWRQLWELARDSESRPTAAVAASEPARSPTVDPSLAGPPESKVTVLSAAAEAGATSASHTPDGNDRPSSDRRHRRVLALGAAVVGAAALVGTVELLPNDTARARAATEETTRSAPALRPAADGTDPYDDGCRADARQVDWRPVQWADGRTGYGSIILMYSPTCQASWGYLQGPVSAKWDAAIVAHRDPDGATAPSDYSGNQPLPGSWGNVLSTRTGCVYVEAYLVVGHREGPHARTACFRLKPVTGHGDQRNSQ